jgi:DNA-directed RNA polymerase subunit L
MDPFSITVGALGITELAISSIEKLHNFINSLAEAKEVVQDIAASLEAIQHPLKALANLKIADSATSDAAKKDLKETGVAEAVNQCGQACAEFTKKLERWTKHPNGKKFSLRVRLSIGVWNKEKIRTLRTRVESCRAIVQFAIGSTQL